MGVKTVQISAVVSEGTKSRLERLAQASGRKKAWIIENALGHYLQALEELPGDVIVPPRIVVDRASGERIIERIEKAPPPTKAMRDLFSE